MSKPTLKRIYIEITNKCNFNCPFCDSATREKREMTESEFSKILNEVKNFTKEICLHVLGEPMIHKDFQKFVEISEEFALQINLVSNGFFLKRHLEFILAHKQAFRKISFSLHSFAHQIEKFPSEFLEVLTGAKALASAGIQVELRHLAGSENEKFARALESSMKEVFEITDFDILKNVKIRGKLFYLVKQPFTWPEGRKNEKIIQSKTEGVFCLALRTHIAILSDLTVVPCCLDSQGNLPLGNLRKDTLPEIIRSENFRKLREAFGNGRALNDFCKTCSYNKEI